MPLSIGVLTKKGKLHRVSSLAKELQGNNDCCERRISLAELVRSRFNDIPYPNKQGKSNRGRHPCTHLHMHMTTYTHMYKGTKAHLLCFLKILLLISPYMFENPYVFKLKAL